MAKKLSALAKITRPTHLKVFPRERLFKMLDQGSRCPLTWISGPPGSGKTTLVASYLASRKLPCLWSEVGGRSLDQNPKGGAS